MLLSDAMRLFVQQDVRYSFPATYGPMGQGMPTALAATPLNKLMVQSTEPVHVWLHKDGKARGVAFYPLYPMVPDAAKNNPDLYELLALVDAVRGGSMRERALAIAELDKRWAS